ncbi:MAG: ATP-binding protein [Clostridiales Family XIII bacterium]|jgi:recombinational DNA repair ATPase RecF|nr:ATP-binding protein [Clostridiales Family XIII bacterium]
MAINRVEIKDFLVFKGEFTMDFCPGVNVFIGSNGTGKTTLLKTLYGGCKGRPFLNVNDVSYNKYDKDDRFDLLVPNNLTSEPVRLYEKQIEKGLGGNE